jgi:hypothetical protein
MTMSRTTWGVRIIPPRSSPYELGDVWPTEAGAKARAGQERRAGWRAEAFEIPPAEIVATKSVRIRDRPRKSGLYS